MWLKHSPISRRLGWSIHAAVRSLARSLALLPDHVLPAPCTDADPPCAAGLGRPDVRTIGSPAPTAVRRVDWGERCARCSHGTRIYKTPATSGFSGDARVACVFQFSTEHCTFSAHIFGLNSQPAPGVKAKIKTAYLGSRWLLRGQMARPLASAGCGPKRAWARLLR